MCFLTSRPPCKGAVGDCWLVAALASASEYRQVIQRAFLVPEYNPRGRYPVRLFDPQVRRGLEPEVVFTAFDFGGRLDA